MAIDTLRLAAGFFIQDFCSAEDGLKALRKLEKRWKYHNLKGIEVVEKRKRKEDRRGRPKNGEDLERFYQIKAGFEEDEGAIKREMLRRGKFIVATNELDSEKLSDEEALKAYKEQQHAERGFKFLKDPLFFAHSMFLENEDRIVAMVMVMGACTHGLQLSGAQVAGSTGEGKRDNT